MNAREISSKIILKFIIHENRLEDLIENRFNNIQLNQKEKKFVYNLCFGVVRNLSLLNWKIGSFYKGNYKKALNKLKAILILALYEIDYLDHIPNFATVNEYVNLAKRHLDKRNSAVVNGILRTYLREKGKYNPEKKFKFKKTQISVKYSFPEWIVEKWIHHFGEEQTDQICKAFNERPDFDLRINKTKIFREDFLNILNENKIQYDISSVFSSLIKVTDIQKINNLKLFQKGYCSIQDESAYLVSSLIHLRENDRVLDACAAPGGKMTAILEENKYQCTLVGSDINKDRIAIIKENCKRLDLTNYNIVQCDAIHLPFKQKFDVILVDAPCTGMGTIRKHPDIKWRRKEGDIEKFQKSQLQIIDSVGKFVKKSGIIIYSTCSINPEENEAVVESFLKNNKKFEMVEPNELYRSFITNKYFIRTFPHKHKMDGGFAAILSRAKE